MDCLAPVATPLRLLPRQRRLVARLRHTNFIGELPLIRVKPVLCYAANGGESSSGSVVSSPLSK